MGMPAAIHRRWTAEEVLSLQDGSRAWPRYELIDGELYVTPAPGVRHQLAVAQFVGRIFPYVSALGFATVLTSPADIELEKDSILQPDVFVFPRLDPAIEKPALERHNLALSRRRSDLAELRANGSGREARSVHANGRR